MPAYVIVETDVHDPEQYERYKAASPAAVAGGGGRFVVRGGAMDLLEGDWDTRRIVVIEFPDMAAAHGWYESEDYAPLKALLTSCRPCRPCRACRRHRRCRRGRGPRRRSPRW